MESESYNEVVISFESLEKNVNLVGDENLIEMLDHLRNDQETMDREDALLFATAYIVGEFYRRELHKRTDIDPVALQYFEKMKDHIDKHQFPANNDQTNDVTNIDSNKNDNSSVKAEGAESPPKGNDQTAVASKNANRNQEDPFSEYKDTDRLSTGGRPEFRQEAIRVGTLGTLFSSFGNIFSTIKNNFGVDKQSSRVLENIGYSAHRYERGLSVDKEHLAECFNYVGNRIVEINKKDIPDKDDVDFLRRAEYVLNEFSRKAEKSTDNTPEERKRLEEFIKMSQDLTRMLSTLFTRLKERFEKLLGEDSKKDAENPSSTSRMKI